MTGLRCFRGPKCVVIRLAAEDDGFADALLSGFIIVRNASFYDSR